MKKAYTPPCIQQEMFASEETMIPASRFQGNSVDMLQEFTQQDASNAASRADWSWEE
jgi:hypothetical protein